MGIPFATARGLRDLHALDAHDFSAEDVSDALAKINRFAGRTPVPWSVASHSVLVCQLAPLDARAWGLLHDAHEMILGDLTSPGQRFIEAESQPVSGGIVAGAVKRSKARLDRMIAEAWQVAHVSPTEIAYWDDVAARAECFHFFGTDPQAPDASFECDVERALALLPDLPQGSDWRSAKAVWLEQARELARFGFLTLP